MNETSKNVCQPLNQMEELASPLNTVCVGCSQTCLPEKKGCVVMVLNKVSPEIRSLSTFLWGALAEVVQVIS